MIRNSVNFWNKRAKVIKVAGSNDPYLNIYETKKLITLLKSKKNSRCWLWNGKLT